MRVSGAFFNALKSKKRAKDAETAAAAAAAVATAVAALRRELQRNYIFLPTTRARMRSSKPRKKTWVSPSHG
jgi:hypothetical protein